MLSFSGVRRVATATTISQPRRHLRLSGRCREAAPVQVAPGAKERRQSKIFFSADEAVADIKSGSTVLSGGSSSVAYPSELR